jgi:peptide/nickel transport system substrate-binding protein/nickel transport system substrate-binding protein
VGVDKNFDITPGVIKKWDINEDSTEYTLYIQEDVKFQDGADFDSTACKYDIEELGKKYFCPYIDTLESIEIIDELTLKVKFGASNVTFLSGLMKVVTLPVDSVDAAGNIINFAGSGPFVLDGYEQDVQATLVRNDHYWNVEKTPKVKKVEWIVIPSSDARVMALESDQVDVIGITEHYASIPCASISALSENENLQFFAESRHNFLSVRGIGLNWKAAPLDDVNLRRALEYCIDREALVKTVHFGIAIPCGHLMNPGFADGPCHETAFTYDLDQAKVILEAAGYVLENDVLSKDGKAIELEYVIDSNSENRDIAVFVQSELQKVGIAVHITALDKKQAQAKLKNGVYNLMNAIPIPWFEPLINALSFFGLQDTYSAYGMGPATNDQIKTAGAAVLGAENAVALAEALDMFWAANYEACPAIPLFSTYKYGFHNSRFTGYKFDCNNIKIDISNVEVS